MHLLKSIQFVFLFPFVEIFYATNDIESELKPCYDHDFSFASPFIRKRTDIHDNFSKSTQHIAHEFKKHIKKNHLFLFMTFKSIAVKSFNHLLLMQILVYLTDERINDKRKT